MRLKLRRVSPGLRPNEVVAVIKTIDGDEAVVIHKKAIDDRNTISVGYPIRERYGKFLVELPRETLKGSWRVWVYESEVEDRP